MPRRMSSRERIDKLRAENEAAEIEKETKRKKKAAAPPKAKATRKKKVAAPVRMKMTWAVVRLGGDIIESYPYPQKAEAEAHAGRLNRDKPGDYIVRPERVPME